MEKQFTNEQDRQTDILAGSQTDRLKSQRLQAIYDPVHVHAKATFLNCKNFAKMNNKVTKTKGQKLLRCHKSKEITHAQTETNEQIWLPWTHFDIDYENENENHDKIDE